MRSSDFMKSVEEEEEEEEEEAEEEVLCVRSADLAGSRGLRFLSSFSFSFLSSFFSSLHTTLYTQNDRRLENRLR